MGKHRKEHRHKNSRSGEIDKIKISEKNKTDSEEKFIGVKLPVIIAEPTININLENTIDFTKNITSIIRIKRKSVIKKCVLIPQVNRVFLDGFVAKSIDYSELEGKVRNLIIKVPFKCATRVEYIQKPVTYEFSYEDNKSIKMSENEECFIDKEQEVDEIYCELVSTEFEELNIKDKIKVINEEKNISTFKQIKQKMSMNITVRLFQKQTIHIQQG